MCVLLYVRLRQDSDLSLERVARFMCARDGVCVHT